MFFQLYYFIPNPHPPRRSALIGTSVAAISWELAKSLFTFYATNIGTFERYRGAAAGSGIAALGDTFGIIIALVVWVYYSGIVLIAGGIVVMVHERRHLA